MGRIDKKSLKEGRLLSGQVQFDLKIRMKIGGINAG